MSQEMKEKTEEEILERIAALYGRLEDLRDQKKEDAGAADRPEGPRVVLVTRRLPRDAPVGAAKRRRVPDTMDQALSNFRQARPPRGDEMRRAVVGAGSRRRRGARRGYSEGERANEDRRPPAIELTGWCGPTVFAGRGRGDAAGRATRIFRRRSWRRRGRATPRLRRG